MSSLINQNLKSKTTPFIFYIRRLLSSLPLIQNPSAIKHEPNYSVDDELSSYPFHLFTSYKNSAHYTATKTKIVHTHLVKSALLYSNIFVANSLLDWYCKSSVVTDAVKLFDRMPILNVVSWNIMISGCSSCFLFEESLGFFFRMRRLGFEPNETSYGSALVACAGLQVGGGALTFCEQVYSLVVKNGFYVYGYVRTRMMDLFAKNGRFDDALRVFNDVACRNVACWNTIISGAVRNGNPWVALDLFRQMCRIFLVPNSFTVSSALTACTGLEDIKIGEGFHGLVIKYGVKDVFVGTAIVDLYAKCGDIADAVKEFNRMPIRNVVAWTAIISGFVRKNDPISALDLFKEMRQMRVEINNFTVTSVITACANPDMIREALQIHCWILKTRFYLDSVVGNTLINMYSKIGDPDLAEMVFKEMENLRTTGTWAVLISSFAQNKSPQRAVEWLQRMLVEGLWPDNVCYSSVLSSIDCLNLGKQIHSCTLKSGLVYELSVSSSLSRMYAKCGRIQDSYEVFLKIPVRDNVSWASMISSFSEHGCGDRALGLFREMLSEGTKPDQSTLNAVLVACCGLRSLQKGKEIHGYTFRVGFDKEALVGGALVLVYSKCGSMEWARKVFDMLPEKDDVLCSSMVSGYVQNGALEEAILLFHEMFMANIALDSFTISSALGAIALSNKLRLGTQLHGHTVKMGLDSSVSAGSSLATMYSKCGTIEDCCKAFNKINEPDLISWTTMIASYAQHGKGEEALKVYEDMRRAGIRPDSITFVGILSACSHTNLVEEGYFHFNSMAKDYGTEPNIHHYACMVDLLGRAGKLREAEMFINSMPIDPGAVIWATLLAACKLHGDTELGRIAAKKVMELEPCDSGAYVSLSNICADVGQWEEVLKVRSQMKGTGVWKDPGWSLS